MERKDRRPLELSGQRACDECLLVKRLAENGKYENFYTVGLRGVHDSGLEATGSPEMKAKLVEGVMTEQRKLLAERVNPDVTKMSADHLAV